MSSRKSPPILASRVRALDEMPPLRFSLHESVVARKASLWQTEGRSQWAWRRTCGGRKLPPKCRPRAFDFRSAEVSFQNEGHDNGILYR